MRTNGLAILVTVLAAGTASAKPKSWAALEASLPAGTVSVVSLDVKAARGTASFRKVVDKLLAEDHKIKDAFDMIHQSCGLDVVASVTDVTAALD